MQISVVMPTWRHAAFIETAIRGVLAQTVPLELVVVGVEGDVETKRKLEELESIFSGQNERIQYFESDRKDHIHQINLGVMKSHGRWVSVCASDDFYLPTKISSELKLAETRRALVVYSDFFYGDADLNILGRSTLPDFSYEGLIARCMITDCSLVATEIYEQFGPLDETLGSIAFFDRWLRIAEKYPDRIIHNPVPEFIYRRHPDQKSEKIGSQKRLGLMMQVARASLKRKGVNPEMLGGYRVVPLEYARP